MLLRSALQSTCNIEFCHTRIRNKQGQWAILLPVLKNCSWKKCAGENMLLLPKLPPEFCENGEGFIYYKHWFIESSDNRDGDQFIHDTKACITWLESFLHVFSWKCSFCVWCSIWSAFITISKPLQILQVLERKVTVNNKRAPVNTFPRVFLPFRMKSSPHGAFLNSYTVS